MAEVTQSIQNLLVQVSAINKKYESIAEITGQNFNVFQILKVGRREVMHSSFIAELLNPKGNHGLNNIFLNLFFRTLGLSEFENDETKYASVRTEVSTEKGRVDILITLNNNFGFVIENKIDAGDGCEQLVHYYYDYPKPKYRLFYLNLDGHRPNDQSIKNDDIKLKEGIDFIRLSYETHILNWLENCKKESVNYPLLRETITQYINLIKYLTNQTINEKMENEIVRSIVQSQDNINSAFAIAASIEETKVELAKKLFDSLIKETGDGYWEYYDNNEKFGWPGIGYFPSKWNKFFIYFRNTEYRFNYIQLFIWSKKPSERINLSNEAFKELSMKVSDKLSKLNIGKRWNLDFADPNLCAVNDYRGWDNEWWKKILDGPEMMKNIITKDVIKIIESLKELEGQL